MISLNRQVIKLLHGYFVQSTMLSAFEECQFAVRRILCTYEHLGGAVARNKINVILQIKVSVISRFAGKSRIIVKSRFYFLFSIY